MFKRVGRLFITPLRPIVQTLTEVLKDELRYDLQRDRCAGMSHNFERSQVRLY